MTSRDIDEDGDDAPSVDRQIVQQLPLKAGTERQQPSSVANKMTTMMSR